MAVSAGYRGQVGDLLGFMPGLAIKSMFGGAGVWSDETMFALIIADELFFKVDEVTRPLFQAEGCGPWLYERGGRLRDMGYNRAPDLIWDDPDEARRWAEVALAAAVRKRKPKAKSRLRDQRRPA